MPHSTKPLPDLPLISFVVTCYNQSDVIGKAVAAALAQDYEPLEVIISDDASADDSVVAIEQAVAGYDGPHRVVINRNERNLGITGQYDRLSEIASGELIVCADGDDVSLPSRTRRFAEVWRAADGEPLLIHGPCLMLDEDGNELFVVHPPDAMRGTPKPVEFLDDYLYAIGANYAWTKDFHRHFGPIAQHATMDDHVLPFRAALIGRIAYLDEPLVRKYPGGMANLAVARSGHDRLFGLHRRELPWKIGDYRQFAADLLKVDRPDRDDLIARARHRLELYEMQYRMANAPGAARRLAMMPGELLRAVGGRSRPRFTSALLYGTAPVSTWLLDKRMRRAQKRQARFADPAHGGPR